MHESQNEATLQNLTNASNDVSPNHFINKAVNLDEDRVNFQNFEDYNDYSVDMHAQLREQSNNYFEHMKELYQQININVPANFNQEDGKSMKQQRGTDESVDKTN